MVILLSVSSIGMSFNSSFLLSLSHTNTILYARWRASTVHFSLIPCWLFGIFGLMEQSNFKIVFWQFLSRSTQSIEVSDVKRTTRRVNTRIRCNETLRIRNIQANRQSKVHIHSTNTYTNSMKKKKKIENYQFNGTILRKTFIWQLN